MEGVPSNQSAAPAVKFAGPGKGTWVANTGAVPKPNAPPAAVAPKNSEKPVEAPKKVVFKDKFAEKVDQVTAPHGSYKLTDAQSELFYVCSVGKSPRRDPPKPFTPEQLAAMEKEEFEKAEITRKKLFDEYILEAVQELHKEGARLDVADDQGNTIIHMLAMCGAPTALEWVSKQPGVKINIRGMNGGTPVFWATSCREDQTLEMLLKLGGHVRYKLVYSKMTILIIPISYR
jgi:hypothetical protein